MNQYTSDRWAGYSGTLRAALDEYARAIREMDGIVRDIPPGRYAGATAPDDKDYPSIASMMEHVIGAGNVYVDYIEDALSDTYRGRRGHEYEYDTPDKAMDAVWHAFGRMVDLLGTISHYAENDMAKVQFVTRWEQRYDLEQMIEHAIVHILRHRRQIENRLISKSLVV